MAIYGSNGSGWQPVASGDLKASDGSEWKTVKKAYRSTGSGWDPIYTGSDPQTYTFVANNSKSARGTQWLWSGADGGGINGLRQGRWAGSYPTGTDSYYRWFGLATFKYDTSGAVTLEDALDERPVVVSATLSLFRHSYQYGFWGSGGGWGNINIGTYSGTITDTSPTPTKISFSNYATKNYAGRPNNALDLNQQAIINLESQSNATAKALLDHAATEKPLVIANKTDTGTGSGGLNNYGSSFDTDYFLYYPYNAFYSTAPLGPTITVELDYS
tara:strand:+ start:10966 stop:11784 length:819 start_codon:yes stop_codon:yes gene_type:complete